MQAGFISYILASPKYNPPPPAGDEGFLPHLVRQGAAHAGGAPQQGGQDVLPGAVVDDLAVGQDDNPVGDVENPLLDRKSVV